MIFDITASLHLTIILVAQIVKNSAPLAQEYQCWVDPYAHPQNIKVLTLFLYICDRCEIHSTGVWSLNHCVTTSLRLGPTPISQKQKSTPDLYRQHSVTVHPYPFAHPKHNIKVLKHLYKYGMDVGCPPHGFGASTIILQHHSCLVLPQCTKNPPLTCRGATV
jgi:hypothetical protein